MITKSSIAYMRMYTCAIAITVRIYAGMNLDLAVLSQPIITVHIYAYGYAPLLIGNNIDDGPPHICDAYIC